MTVSRITFNTFSMFIGSNLSRVQRDYQQASVPVQTGFRINNLSDDPTSISRLFALREEVSNNEQYQRNLSTARSKLSFTENQIANSSEVMSKVKDIALQANNSTVSPTSLTELATQLGNLKTELLNYANATYDNQYVFAGTATSTVPFAGSPTAFAGNTTAIYVQAHKNLQIRVNTNGDTTFTGAGGGQDLFDVIDDLQTAVAAGDITTITATLTRIDTSLDQLNQARSNIGVRMQQLETVETNLAQERLDAMARLSDVRDISVDEATTNLITKETALKLVYASSNRLFSVLGSLTLEGR